MNTPPLVTIPEAAEALVVSIATIRRMIQRGDLPAVRVGAKLLRVPREALDRLLAEDISCAHVRIDTHTRQSGDDAVD